MNMTNVTVWLDLLGAELTSLSLTCRSLSCWCLKSCSELEVMHHITRPHELGVHKKCQWITNFVTQAMSLGSTIQHSLSICASCSKVAPPKALACLSAWWLSWNGQRWGVVHRRLFQMLSLWCSGIVSDPQPWMDSGSLVPSCLFLRLNYKLEGCPLVTDFNRMNLSMQ